jgi:hypothetical protein
MMAESALAIRGSQSPFCSKSDRNSASRQSPLVADAVEKGVEIVSEQ